jgi:hypothetical protein
MGTTESFMESVIACKAILLPSLLSSLIRSDLVGGVVQNFQTTFLSRILCSLKAQTW